MPLSKKRVHHLQLRLLAAERAKRRRETTRYQKHQKMPAIRQPQAGIRVDSEFESETDTDSECDEEDSEDSEAEQSRNRIASEGYMEECNVVGKEDLREKGPEIQTLQWQEGAGSSLPQVVRGDRVGWTALWKRGVKAQQLALEGQKSYRITDLWERQKDLGISFKKKADKDERLSEGDETIRERPKEGDFDTHWDRPSRQLSLQDLPRGLAIVPEWTEKE